MWLSRLFHASAFRLALGYVVLFVTSGAAVALFVVWTSEGLVGRQIDATIEAEITGLAERYRRAGVAGLSQVVRERSRNQRLSLYLLAGPDRRPLVGNLDGWPPVQTQDGVTEITRFTAEEDGTFLVPLAAGTYRLVPLSGPNGFPFAEEQTVDVVSGEITQVQILFDTGIR